MPVYTNEDKCNMLQHVHYEIQSFMLVPEYDKYHKPKHDGEEPKENEALRESVTMRRVTHWRALKDFFYKSNRQDDDVLACDFNNFSPTAPRISDSLIKRFNKDVFHLTYSRLHRKSPQEKLWPLGDVFPTIEQCCNEFINHILNESTQNILGYDVQERQRWENLRTDIYNNNVLVQNTANTASPQIFSSSGSVGQVTFPLCPGVST